MALSGEICRGTTDLEIKVLKILFLKVRGLMPEKIATPWYRMGVGNAVHLVAT